MVLYNLECKTEVGGKTVDVALKGVIPSDSTVVFAASEKKGKDLQLKNVKTVRITSQSENVKIEDFYIPQGDNIELSVFVWNSLSDRDAFSQKYIYSLKN